MGEVRACMVETVDLSEQIGFRWGRKARARQELCESRVGFTSPNYMSQALPNTFFQGHAVWASRQWPPFSRFLAIWTIEALIAASTSAFMLPVKERARPYHFSTRRADNATDSPYKI